MLFESEVKKYVAETMLKLHAIDLSLEEIAVNETRKEFEGDLTVVVFNMAKKARMNPDQLANEIGNYLIANFDLFSSFNVIKGFLNLVIVQELWMKSMQSFEIFRPQIDPVSTPILVEYSSPNTNKPLHLGHMRNILLGYSVAEILLEAGQNVKKVNLVNDRGIHICKSMLAWKLNGGGETPTSSGLKGDHLVGKYYVEFDKIYKQEIKTLVEGGISEEEAKKKAPVMLEAQKMLVKWEQGDEETIALWKKMNGWVYDGFASTYDLMGVDFDKMYYESDTYLLGKELVHIGLKKGVFFEKYDGSIWVDLTEDGLDQKLLLRGDGTSVYVTQDLGTAKLRFDEFGFKRLIYVVGNEQEYHFKVLRLVMKKLGFEWWDSLHHLSYAMVDLPSGKMKSREGTVVDADELMQEMIEEAKRITIELGKIEDFDSSEANELYKLIGLGALKYYILKVDPEKRMLFNPEESIDFNGNTGPFIQYTYARIKSVLRKGEKYNELKDYKSLDLVVYSNIDNKERSLLLSILNYHSVVQEAAAKYSPAIIANYVFELAKQYNQFYHEHPIVDITTLEISKFRLLLSERCSEVIKKCLGLLGINVPERM